MEFTYMVILKRVYQFILVNVIGKSIDIVHYVLPNEEEWLIIGDDDI